MPKEDVDHLKVGGPIKSLLAALRRRIRTYVWLHGLAAAAALVGFCFWLSLGLDFVFEPPVPLRMALLVVSASALAYLVFRMILRRVTARLADRNMALLVERRYPEFRDSLVTVVELAEQPDVARRFNPEMLSHAHETALARARTVDLGQLFDRRPLARAALLAVLLLTSMAAFGIAASDAFAVWARRSLMLSGERWPRKTRLVAVGFDHGRAKVARGADYDLVVKADAQPGRFVPDTVELRYTMADGARTRELMTRRGVAAPGREAFQHYGYTFKDVLAPISFYALGGDDRLGPLELEVVESPSIRAITLDCKFPKYMERAPREIAVTGVVQVPRGSEIALHAVCTKELTAADVETVDERGTARRVFRATPEQHEPRRFQVPLGVLDSDKTLLIKLLDSDGTTNREPVRIALAAKADDPPEMTVELDGIGEAITPRAQIPITGRITDDYGIGRAWIEYRVPGGSSGDIAFHRPAAGRSKLAVRETIEAESLKLAPDQKLELAVHAADRFALAGAGPNVAVGQRFMLSVVTPEHLRLLLEARELILRRRFETIIAELSETRDILAGVDLSSSAVTKNNRAAVERPGAASPSTAKPVARHETSGSKPPARDPASADDPIVRRRVHTDRTIQNTSRSRHETRDVAGDFRRIHRELINNKLDSPELEARIVGGIVDPLERLADGGFMRTATHLEALQSVLGDSKLAVEPHRLALAEIDAILVEMKQVLSKMLELETFNEVLDLLRGVIDAQKTLTEQTKQRQKSDLNSLED